MFQWLFKLIRKLFLIKEIISKDGIVHFRRYRVLSTPWFNIYIHNILQSDRDEDMHDHPFDFKSVILKGSYTEKFCRAPNFDQVETCTYYPGDVVEHKAEDCHKITLNSLFQSVWTLVFTSGRNREWGYLTKHGWCWHKKYRTNIQMRRYGVKLMLYSGRQVGWWLYNLNGRYETPSREEAVNYAVQYREQHPKADVVIEEINWVQELLEKEKQNV